MNTVSAGCRMGFFKGKIGVVPIFFMAQADRVVKLLMLKLIGSGFRVQRSKVMDFRFSCDGF